MKVRKTIPVKSRCVVLIALTAVLLLGGCGERQKNIAAANFGDTIYMPEYARGFHIISAGQSSVITIRNPWQGSDSVDLQLFVSRGGERAPEGFEGAVVEAPLKKVVCMSSSYVAFLDAIGETGAVKAVSGAGYVSNDSIRARYSRGEVREAGYDANVNFELLVNLKPDIVFLYGISGENSLLTRKLDELSIEYIYIGEYVEQSPLGKSEWLAVFGELFDKRDHAVAVFDGIKSRYNETLGLVAKADSAATGSEARDAARPVVMLNAPYRDTWFVPGDRSYMVRLIADAGGRYACAGVDSDQSRPISEETAYIFAMNSDIWLNPGQAMTMNEVRSLNSRFTGIPAVRNGRVYNSNLRVTPEGGSDFWESGAVKADVVLRDMVGVIRPELLPGHEFYYFRKME